ncbi:hypothetical protein KPH14_012455 [Odynerus spinipes]|uniref:DNA ligase 4 n=1 Tax=Odynerus spinipes TaxID=1348599 RepID=A0AAD9RJC4_9HYME|nr:hypothetical protein KPH14_012455 [Odynerus spinipes]
MSVTLSSRIKFKRLCDVLEKVVKERGSGKLNILKEFLVQCQKEGVKLKNENPDVDVSMFPILRLLLPQCDRDRGSYNLKEKLLANLYIRVFCLGKSSKDAQKLIEYKIPNVNKSGGSDFAEKVYWVLQKRLSRNKETFTIDRINTFLDDLSRTNETNNNKDELFKTLFRQISALELKWLTRIILKDLKLGVGTKKLLQVYHPEAYEFFDITSDLRKICDNIYGNKEKLSYDIQVFSFFKPMLLERCGIEDVEKLFHNNDEYFVQTKYDGERSQIHMKDGVFKYCTRRRNDITDNWGYGEKSADGFLTNKFSRLLNPQCKSIILDGELMGWHKENKVFGSKGMSYDVKKLSTNSSHQPCFVAFDVILYNDKVLVNLPYKERLSILQNAFQDEEGSLIKCQNTIVSNSEDLLDIFNKSIRDDGEGIVLKKTDATYKPNVREGSGCYKIKAEYSENLVQDIDLIVLGGYYGEGKFTGLISSFMMGVTEMPKNKGEDPTKFISVVSVSNGLSMEQMNELNSRLEQYWIKDCPDCIIQPKGQLPDLWIQPEHSIILTLRATELVRTDYYPMGYSLRFPRVVEIRNDKPWYSACTNTELLWFVKGRGAIHKLTKRQATSNDIMTPAVKTPKISKSTLSKFEEGCCKTRELNTKVVPITRLLEGKEICVINGDDELSKEKIEDTLLLHRAKIVQNPSKETYCVIVGNANKAKAKNIIHSNKYDVVTIDWFKHVTKEENWGTLEDFLPWYLLCVRESTRRLLAEKYDDYYDSYTVDADEQSLQRSLEKAKYAIKDSEVFTQEQGMDKELFDNGISPFSVFRKIIGYFKNCSDSTKFQFRFMGGLVKEEIDKCVNYIFIEDNSMPMASSSEVDRIEYESIKIVNNRSNFLRKLNFDRIPKNGNSTCVFETPKLGDYGIILARIFTKR